MFAVLAVYIRRFAVSLQYCRSSLMRRHGVWRPNIFVVSGTTGRLVTRSGGAADAGVFHDAVQRSSLRVWRRNSVRWHKPRGIEIVVAGRQPTETISTVQLTPRVRIGASEQERWSHGTAHVQVRQREARVLRIVAADFSRL